MKSILVTSQKGGTGKTTQSINLARGLQLRGYSVMNCDTDWQKSQSTYYQQSPEIGLEYSVGLESLSQYNNYDFVIIDSSPRLDERLLKLYSQVDYILIPVTASQLDFWATEDILSLLDNIKADKRTKNHAKVGFFFNNATNQRIKNEIEQFLQAEKFTVLGELHKRVAYSVELNRTVFESKNKVAINEINRLIDALLSDLFN